MANKVPKKLNLKNLALGAGVAVIAGYVAGVLTAPRSGKQTRRSLTKSGLDEYKSAEAKLKLLHSEITELMSSVKDGHPEANDSSLKSYEAVLDKAKMSKDKLNSVLSAVKAKQSTDKDLDQAIKEAEKAITHVKNFLLKK